MTTAQPQRRGATILLIRHGETDAAGARLCGRAPGVHLNDRGRDQARALADALRHRDVAAVYSSPLDRTRETAQPIAAAHALPLRVLDDLNEVDFGEWTGLTFAELATRDAWRRYNQHRSRAVVPGGETPAATQRRVMEALDQLMCNHPGALIVAVSHAEPIRYAHLHRTGRPLDAWHTVAVETASILTIAEGDVVTR